MLNSVLPTDQRVAHISLVFREMWETLPFPLALGASKYANREQLLPHLAKNERDMGHPLVRGEEISQSRLLNAVLMQTLFSICGSLPGAVIW